MALVPTRLNPTDILREDDIPPGMPTTGPDLGLQLKIWSGTQILWPFLRNPPASPICAATVYKMTRRLLTDPPPSADTTKSSVRILRTKHQQFLDAMVHFVAIPRPEMAHALLEIVLDKCDCDLTMPVLETIHENDNFAPWTCNDMIGSIFLLLAKVMENVKIGHIPGPHSAAVRGETQSKKWPSSTASVFPQGPEDAAVAFTRLYRATGAPEILDFIRFTLPHCPSLAAPAIKSPALWQALVEELQRAVENIDTDPRITGIDSVHKYEDGPPPTRIIQTIAMLIHTLSITFTESLRQNIQSSALIPFARNIHDLLLKVLIRIKRSPEKTKLAEFCHFVTGIAMSAITALPKDHPQRPPTLHPVLLAYAQLVKSGNFGTVYSVITRLTQSVAECCSATCTATSESSTQKLRYCAQCQVMRYCSSACQKTAWKYHKLVCKDLETLKKVVSRSLQRDKERRGELGSFLREFEKEARKLGFTDQRMGELSAELGPFLHFQNAGMTKAVSHEKAHHY